MTAINSGFLGRTRSGDKSKPPFRKIQSKSCIDVPFVDLDLTLDPDWDHYLVIADNLLPATNIVVLTMQMSVTNGGTFESAAASYQYRDNEDLTDNTSASGFSTGATTINIAGATVSNALAGGGLSFWMSVVRPRSTDMNKQVWWDGSHSNSASATFSAMKGVGVGISAVLTNNPVHALRFQWSTGNHARGRLTLFGINRSDLGQ